MDRTFFVLAILAALAVVMIILVHYRTRTDSVLLTVAPLNGLHIISVVLLLFGLWQIAIVLVTIGILWILCRALYVWKTKPEQLTERLKEGKLRTVIRHLVLSLSILALAAWIGVFLWGSLLAAPMATFSAAVIILVFLSRVVKRLRESDETSALVGS